MTVYFRKGKLLLNNSKYLNGIVRGNKLFTLLETEQKIIATSVDHDLFEQKNEALKKCHETFSDLQLKLSGSKIY